MSSPALNPFFAVSDSSPSGEQSTPPAGSGDLSEAGLEAAESRLPAGPHKVLVVDGDIERADQLVALMENVGYEVEVATDGHYGLMLADKFEPEVILLAIEMPGMTGFEVTQVLRNEPRYAQRFRFTRIFYITDKAQMLQKRFDAFPGTPMSDYIFTPIDIPELLEKVARALGEPVED